MKSTGIVRKLDELGRIVIPKEMRRRMRLGERAPLEIYVDGDSIMLKKYNPGCIFCDNASDIVDFEGKRVCKECLKKLCKDVCKDGDSEE